ncbi:MAG: hypothetical protein WKF60_11935, partial [Ilumatobacter sp.]
MAKFADKPTIDGERITLRPIAASDTEHMWADAHDPEITYFTGSHGEFTHDRIAQWCATRADQTDRLDMAAVDAETGEWL